MTLAFGPVPSRRLGHSLGINNVPAKTCSYSCVYCQLGPTEGTQCRRRAFFAPEEVARAVGERVARLRARGEKIDYLTFVPDGEPTLDSGLAREIEILRPLGLPIAVISNASLISQPAVRDALARADWVSLKVDAADETVWRRVNRPDPALRHEEILTGLGIFARDYGGTLVSETMLVDGVNDDERCLAETAALLAGLAPATAYILVPTRPTAEPWAKPASDEAVTRAYASFAHALPRVETITGEKPGEFGFTGNVIDDLLGITTVHPMREREMRDLLAKAGGGLVGRRSVVGEGRAAPNRVSRHDLLHSTRRLIPGRHQDRRERRNRRAGNARKGFAMEEKIRHLIERFPERAEVIRALGESHARFKDLIGDHHDVSLELSTLKRGDRESNLAKAEELQRRRADIEEELILLMENHQRI